MKKKLFIALVCIGFIAAKAEKASYVISEIPAALKANAHTVYREISYHIELKSESEATVKVTEVRSILNKNGESNVIFIESYNPMNKISSLRGWAYDENGKRVRSLSNEDAYDRSNMGYSMYDENRIRVLDPKYLTFPMTVKYEYELSLKQTLFVPSLSLSENNCSYEKVNYTVTVPSTMRIKYKEYNMPVGCDKSTIENKTIYSWKLENITAKTSEPYSPHFSPNSPTVRIVPEKFQVDDYKGSTDSWQSFGIWAAELLNGKEQLPATTEAQIKALTANMTNDYDKVKAVYEYMQKKTRYVSVQIGIGGWQPFAAELVDKNSYGDCKALSNYTKSLLAAAGMKAHYVLVQAGDRASDIDTSFVSSQFNHAIVCVPMAKDTLWLEATSQIAPCAYNGDFTDDRWVLLVDKDKSKIVRTRIYPANENCIKRSARVSFDSELGANAKVSTHYQGLCYDEMQSILLADNNEKKQRITNHVRIPSFSLQHFTLNERRNMTPEIEEVLDISLTNYITSLNGSMELLPLNLMNKFDRIPEKVRNRKNQLSIRRSYMEEDSIVYQLPKNYKITATPNPVYIQTVFGEYKAEVKIKDNEVYYFRRLALNKGVHAAEEYANFRSFLEQVKTNDDAVLGIQKI